MSKLLSQNDHILITGLRAPHVIVCLVIIHNVIASLSTLEREQALNRDVSLLRCDWVYLIIMLLFPMRNESFGNKNIL
jgi:hypothetical protein